MFCNKCGSQLPDGTRFCKFCGAQLPTVPVEYDDYAAPPAEPVPMPMQPPMAPPPMQPHMVPPPVQPQMVPPPNDYDEPKKGKAGYVIIAVVAIILIATVIITAILLFGNKDGTNKDSEDTTATTQASTLMAGGSSQTTTTTEPSTSDTTTEPSSESSTNTTDPSVPSTATPVPNPTPNPTPNPEPQPPKVDLSGAEYAAKRYLESIDALDMKNACSYEIVGWYDFSYAFEELLLEEYESYYGYLTYDELYSIISEETGYDITDVEDIFDVASEQTRAEGDFATIRVKYSKEISKSESTKFINATKSQIDSLNYYGIYSDDYDWNAFSSFAQVNSEAIYSDGSKESISMLLGYAYGDWYVIYVESDSDPVGLYSLYIIENWYE